MISVFLTLNEVWVWGDCHLYFVCAIYCICGQCKYKIGTLDLIASDYTEYRLIQVQRGHIDLNEFHVMIVFILRLLYYCFLLSFFM